MRTVLALPFFAALVVSCQAPPATSEEPSTSSPPTQEAEVEPEVVQVPPEAATPTEVGEPPRSFELPEQGAEAAARLAHDAYVAAINSNDLQRVLAVLTDDVVFLAAGAPPMVGRDAVRPWLAGYLAVYTTHWTKTVQEFVVIGDWAFERYAWRSVDAPIAGGALVEGSGWGLALFRRCGDGAWRVARDAWGPDRAPRK